MLRRPQTSTLCPYTTRFRSAAERERDAALLTLDNLPPDCAPDEDTVLREVGDATKTGRDHLELAGERVDMERGARLSGSRSEEHTSELQSRPYLVCRLLLEK